jgi:hypothetical protein
MKPAIVLALVVLAVACMDGRSSAELDPRCANVDLDSHTVRALTNEMQGFVDTSDMSSARYVYQSGIRMALADYDLASHCGSTFDLTSMDAAFEQLVEQAYYDRIIGAGEAQVWMRSLLAGAYNHGDTRDQIDAWTAFARALAAETGHRFQRPPHQQ